MITGGSEAAITPHRPERLRRHAGPLRAERRSRRAPAAPSTATATASCSAKARACWCSKNWNTPRPAAPESTPRCSATAPVATAATSPQPDKDGVGAAYAMAQALKDAGVDPDDIDYINAHGTSTPLGDQAETTAIKTVFKDHATTVSISSTKSQLGHLLGASGGVELIFCMLAFRDGVIPPTINLETPDPAVRSGLHAQPGPAAQDLRGHVEQLRLRRPQRLAGGRQAAK